MEKNNYSEQSAINLAIAGDERGYRYLMDKYKSFAFSIAIQIVKNEQNAEEIVQDSFIKAFKAISKYKHISKFSTWLYKIVYNTSLTSIRGKRLNFDTINESSDAIFEIPDNCKNGFHQLIAQDRARYLKKAISKLSEMERVAATLYYLNQCTIQEIENITNWNASTIKSRLFRGRQKLYYELSTLLNTELNDLV